MKKIKPILPVLLLWAACSCRQGSNTSGKQDAAGLVFESLAADSIAIRELLQPRQIAILRDYAVAASPSTDKAFYLYRLPDWTFAGDFGTKGGGPDEFQYAYLQSDANKDNTFWVSDPGKKQLMKFEATPQGLDRIRTVKTGEGWWIFHGAVLSDSIQMMTKTTDMGKEYKLFSFTMTDSLHLSDSLRTFTKTETKEFKSAETWTVTTILYNQPAIFSGGDRLVVWYSGTENLYLYSITAAGKIHLEQSFGDPITYDLIQGRDDLSSMDKTEATELLSVSDRYLYFKTEVYDQSGKAAAAQGKQRKTIKNTVKVYDRAMNPVAEFFLDKKEATKILIDENRKKIYAYNPRLDFEQVYIYDYKL